MQDVSSCRSGEGTALVLKRARCLAILALSSTNGNLHMIMACHSPRLAQDGCGTLEGSSSSTVVGVCVSRETVGWMEMRSRVREGVSRETCAEIDEYGAAGRYKVPAIPPVMRSGAPSGDR